MDISKIVTALPDDISLDDFVVPDGTVYTENRESFSKFIEYSAETLFDCSDEMLEYADIVEESSEKDIIAFFKIVYLELLARQRKKESENVELFQDYDELLKTFSNSKDIKLFSIFRCCYNCAIEDIRQHKDLAGYATFNEQTYENARETSYLRVYVGSINGDKDQEIQETVENLLDQSGHFLLASENSTELKEKEFIFDTNGFVICGSWNVRITK